MNAGPQFSPNSDDVWSFAHVSGLNQEVKYENPVSDSALKAHPAVEHCCYWMDVLLRD